LQAPAHHYPFNFDEQQQNKNIRVYKERIESSTNFVLEKTITSNHADVATRITSSSINGNKPCSIKRTLGKM